MKKLYLDIETLPASGEQMAIIKNFYEEAKKKKALNGTGNGSSRQNQNEATSFDNYFRGTSFSGEFGRIFCIGYAVDDQPAECLSGTEKEILTKFWEIARDASLFIGHNVMDFDMRFIYKRSIVNNIKPTQDLSFARYRSNPIFDTMKEWEKWGAIGASLHKLSIALGIASPKEEGIDGSQVYDFFLAGKTAEIVEYCIRDVEATRKIYKRITFS
ncbi:MAG: ribonuclease H-like domain-containing protein [Candidatus Berkelbacteria bacterium]|nr:ribonuclease H-like domain-containing protein [Candidatus Berkelbacteria bacterium]